MAQEVQKQRPRRLDIVVGNRAVYRIDFLTNSEVGTSSSYLQPVLTLL